MSHNLILISATGDELSLVQTPTEVTSLALRSGGQASAVIAYEQWLRSSGWRADGGGDYRDEIDDYAPGWSWDPITRHLALIDAFLAFAPGARFGAT